MIDDVALVMFRTVNHLEPSVRVHVLTAAENVIKKYSVTISTTAFDGWVHLVQRQTRSPARLHQT